MLGEKSGEMAGTTGTCSHLEEQPAMPFLTDSMVGIELSRFMANDYRGQIGCPPFQLVGGSLPALVSAPHAVTHWRGGRMKPSDDYTGSMALALAGAFGCHAMVALNSQGHDPNWDPHEACPYKQALCTYVREHGIRLVIDLHGMPAASPDAVEVGSADGATVESLPGADVLAVQVLGERLSPWLERHGKSVGLNGRHAARGANTVASTVARECGVAALQLEVNTRFRVPSGAGSHHPEGDPIPFSSSQLADELEARRNPDPACVDATARTIASIILRLVA